jgi:hypothetical protein
MICPASVSRYSCHLRRLMVVLSSWQPSTALCDTPNDYTNDIVPGVWLHPGSKLLRISLYHYYCYQSMLYSIFTRLVTNFALSI